nr:RNA-directed DNA polymerase, eukaryota [Tanacetum cinerariifolium]
MGIPSSTVMQAASSIGCGVLHKQFRYLGVMVGECGRLTLLKAVLGASPLSNMSIFKVPKGIPKSMEAIRSKFFNGMEPSTNKITWAAWNNVLASKENGGLGVSSYHALNRALLLKWVWRFISQDGSLWFSCYKSFEVTVADKVQGVVSSSFRHPVRAGSEYQYLTDLNSLMESVSLSHSYDRWICDLSGDGEFRVKEENIHHVLFGCGLAENIFRRICRWWELDWQALESFSDWNYWFSLIRLSSKVKALLEGVFGVAWWSIWRFRNRSIYNEMPPRRSVLFDDI